MSLQPVTSNNPASSSASEQVGAINPVHDSESVPQPAQFAKNSLSEEFDNITSDTNNISDFPELEACRKIIDEMSVNKCTPMKDLRKTFCKYQPVTICPRANTSEILGPMNTISDRTLVVRIKAKVNTHLVCTKDHVPEQDLNLDIAFSDDSTTITTLSDHDTFPSLDSAAHVSQIASMVTSSKVHYVDNIQSSITQLKDQHPQFLAYLFGQLLAIRDRIKLAQPRNHVDIFTDIFMPGANNKSRPIYDDFDHAQSLPGPVVMPPDSANAYGPCNYRQLCSNQPYKLDPGMVIFMSPRSVDNPALMNFLWLLYGVWYRMPPTMKNQFPWDITVVSSEPAPGRHPPPFNKKNYSLISEALTAGFDLILSMFNGDHELMQYYQRKGIETMFRPCSFYTEGGLIRKAIRYITMKRVDGAYFYSGGEYASFTGLHKYEHPGLVGALESFVDIMVLQAVLSFTGPKVVAFVKDPDDVDPESQFGKAISQGDGFVFDINSPSPKLRAYYLKFLNRPCEQKILQTAMSQIHGVHSDIVVANIYNSLYNANTQVVNKKIRTNMLFRSADSKNLRNNVAIINRFHDPEFAYGLGILADGINPLQGKHDYDIVKELDYLFSGGDLRNCPGINAYNGRGLDHIIHVHPDKHTCAFYMTLDRQMHAVTVPQPLSKVYAWKDHGNLTRPYACHVLQSNGLQFFDVSNGMSKGTLFIKVYNPLRASRAYMGPRFAPLPAASLVHQD